MSEADAKAATSSGKISNTILEIASGSFSIGTAAQDVLKATEDLGNIASNPDNVIDNVSGRNSSRRLIEIHIRQVLNPACLLIYFVIPVSQNNNRGFSVKKIIKTVLKGTSLALALLYASGAAAITYNEVGDAGQLLPTAQSVSNGTTQINGSLDSVGDVDLFAFSIATETTLTIDGLGDYFNASIDANLILFDGTGRGIEGDDDGGYGLESRMTVTLAAGDYLIAFGDNNIEALDSSGYQLISNDDGFVGLTTGILGGWDAYGGDTGAYQIAFSSAVNSITAVPLPAALPLFGAGLLAMGFAGLRRRQKG